MRRISQRSSSLARALPALWVFTCGCPAPTAVDDDSTADDDSTGDDDDSTGSDDDSAAVDPPSWTFDRTDLTAGAWEELTVTVENFEFSEGVEVLPGGGILLVGSEQVGARDFVFTLMPGLLTEGAQEFGISGVSGVLTQTFTVTGIEPVAAPYTAAAATGGVDGPGAYQVYSLGAATLGQMVLIQAGGSPAPSFHPRLWLFDQNGLDILSQAGGSDGEGGYGDPILAHSVAADGPFFLRIDDADRLGGADFTYTLDLDLVTPPGEPVAVTEVEPNDLAGEWQDFGPLPLGAWTLSGECTEVGYDEETYLATGDIDGFTFSVPVVTLIDLRLAWDEADPAVPVHDLDVVVFDGANPGLSMGIGSEALVNGDGYSTNEPEVANFLAQPGVSYLITVWEWEVEPMAWTLEISAVPFSF